MISGNITFYDIQAFVDQQLGDKEKTIVIDFIQKNWMAEQYYIQICHQKYLLQKLWNQKKQ